MNDVLKLILQASVVAKAILLILLFFSVVSWAIILEKARALRKLGKESHKFLSLFQIKTGWAELYRCCRAFRHSPFAQIFEKGYHQIQAWNEHPRETDIVLQNDDKNPTSVNEKRTALAEVLDVAIAEETTALEQHLIFLATTGSVSPFFGLLGTVWGVMSAFMSMGTKGSADLGVVGPGVAEALITTIAGLGVAIPAVIAYNYFVDKLRRLEGKLEVFSSELVRMAERENIS